MLAVLTTGARMPSLRACVRGISRLSQAQGVSLDLVIVQNSGTGLSRDVAAIEQKFATVSDIILEPQKGIPQARNRAIRLAIERRYDYLAFIDDDAVPQADWLVEGVRALRQSGADAVTGPQHPVFPETAPARLRSAAIYKAVNDVEGKKRGWAATNNVIFSTRFVREHELLMDESFTTGGSDKEFFKRFVRAGGRIIWAPKAIVTEEVTEERLTLAWAIRRSWRLGTTGFRIERASHGHLTAAVICVAKGGMYVLAGLVLLPLIVIPRHAACIDGLCYITHGAGFILGISPGFRPRRYS
jgi:succinoglycan biosynthesis protein ExoM